MTRVWVSFVIGLLLVAVGHVSARCAQQCYHGVFEADATSPSIPFSFSVIPCGSASVIESSVSLDGSPALASCTLGADGRSFWLTLAAKDGSSSLAWEFAGVATCNALLSDISAASILRTIFSSGATRVESTSAPALSSFIVECAGQCDRRVCLSVSNLSLNGRAWQKSPCGTIGAQRCQADVVIEMDQCRQTLTRMDALVGPNKVALSLFAPDLVSNGLKASCTDGQFIVESSGMLMILNAPTSNDADCATMWQYVSREWLGGVNGMVMIGLSDDEVWTTAESSAVDLYVQDNCVAADSVNAPVVESVTSVPVPSHSPSINAESFVLAEKPVKPVVLCSKHIGNNTCFTIFGYTNANLDLTCTNKSVLIPSISSVSPPTHFSGNKTNYAAFAVEWNCPEYKRHFLRWKVETTGSNGRTWTQSVDVERNQDDKMCVFV